MSGSSSEYRGCVQRSDYTLCVDSATIYSLLFYCDYLQRSDILPIFMHSSITYTHTHTIRFFDAQSAWHAMFA